MDLHGIQRALSAAGIDAWLLCDFFNRDAIAYRVLGMDFSHKCSRRWYYLIPARGEPRRLVHAVESTKLDALPGGKRIYRTWCQLDTELTRLLDGMRVVAMNYSPRNEIPYVAKVDAGTIEKVRDTGVEVVTSADLVQTFEALIDEAGYASHLAAGEVVHRVKDEAFAEIEAALKKGLEVTEWIMQQFMLGRLAEAGMALDGDVPIVGVNDHPANPHFFPTPDNARVIRPGDVILIDVWARLDRPGTIYHDITWMGFAGAEAPARYSELFSIVAAARDAAVDFVTERFASGTGCAGWEVDDACRAVIESRGYGDAFVHRTGHSMGRSNHGNGVNLDNLETRDTRRLVPGVLCSVEPGIYLQGDVGLRSEIDLAVRPGPVVTVTGPAQTKLISLDV